MSPSAGPRQHFAVQTVKVTISLRVLHLSNYLLPCVLRTAVLAPQTTLAPYFMISVRVLGPVCKGPKGELIVKSRRQHDGPKKTSISFSRQSFVEGARAHYFPHSPSESFNLFCRRTARVLLEPTGVCTCADLYAA